MGRCFSKKWIFFAILGAAFPPRAPIGLKFCSAKQTHVPRGSAKFHMNLCNESPPAWAKIGFWPVSKFNTNYAPLETLVYLSGRPQDVTAVSYNSAWL